MVAAGDTLVGAVNEGSALLTGLSRRCGWVRQNLPACTLALQVGVLGRRDPGESGTLRHCTPRRSAMEQEALRRLIRNKLADGRLPQNSIPRLWGGAGNGETCDACEEVITKTQFVMEGISTTGGLGIQFHVGCLHMWDAERQAPGRGDPAASDALPTYGPGE